MLIHGEPVTSCREKLDYSYIARINQLMTEAERQELEQCSRRMAELLYKEAREQQRPVSSLGEIEATIRTQLQEHVSPRLGTFFVKPPVAQTKDISGPSTASSDT